MLPNMPHLSIAPALFLIALTGCGEDPVLEAAREEAASQSGASQGGPPPGQGGSEGPGTPGVPEDPPPGDPGQPPPPGDGASGGDGTIPPPSGVETVTLSGSVEVEDYTRGVITIDVFDGDNKNQHGGKRPDIVGRVKIDAPGPFELEVEKGKTVWLSAYADQDENNRPSQEDPLGVCECNPVSADYDAGGLVLKLTRGHPPKE